MCSCVYIHVRIYVYTCIYQRINLCVLVMFQILNGIKLAISLHIKNVLASIHICLSFLLIMRMCVCVYIFKYVCVYMYVCICVYSMYLCVYECTCVYRCCVQNLSIIT